MDVFTPLKTVFLSLGQIMQFRFNLSGFSFTIGEMVVGLIIISLSVVLLRYLFTGGD